MFLLVTRFAHGDELPLARVRIEDAECEIWPLAQMLDMVDDGPPGVPAPGLANLALEVVHFQDGGAELLPGGPPVEAGLLPGVDEPPEPVQARLADVVDHASHLPSKRKKPAPSTALCGADDGAGYLIRSAGLLYVDQEDRAALLAHDGFISDRCPRQEPDSPDGP